MERHIFGRRYEEQEKIGTGGSAHVYRATDRLLGRDVAVKVLHEHASSDPAYVERFRREARSAAALNHPNIVSIYDTGEIGDVNYIVMEYVAGSNLKDVIRSGPLPERQVLDIAIQVADALQTAHESGLIHRDVKPHNVLLTPAGRAKVVDFGIARAQGLTQLTQTNAVHGTAHYISPEQARGNEVDARSDEYSLGVVIYEMLTGREPFRGESLVEVALHHIHDQPIPPRVLRPEISVATEAIVLRALAKEPTDRFPSMHDMSTALLEARNRLDRELEIASPTTVAPIASTTSRSVVPVKATRRAVPSFVESPSSPSRRPASSWLWLAPLVLALLVGGIAFAAFERPGTPHSGPNGSHRVAARATLAQPTSTKPASAPSTPVRQTRTHSVVSTGKTPSRSVVVAGAGHPPTSPSPTISPAPTPTPTLVKRVASKQASSPGARVQSAVAASLPTPAQAVRQFYANIQRGDLNGAAGLWTTSMRNRCDPNSCIFQRFTNTTIQVENIGPVLQNEAAGTATVPVQLREYRSGSNAFTTITGNWYLVRTSSGWMLDNEDLAVS